MARDYLFDIGNVILRFDLGRASRGFGEHSSIAAEDPMAVIQECKDDLEFGRIDDDTFISTSMGLLGFRETPAEFARIWCEIFELNAPMVPIIQDLARSGNRLYLLSNTNGLHKDYFFRTYPIFESFRGGIFSHTAHSMKPEATIFEQAFSEFGLTPAETVYIDDHPENIAKGRQLGLRSILYDPDRHEDFVPRLDAAAT